MTEGERNKHTQRIANFLPSGTASDSISSLFSVSIFVLSNGSRSDGNASAKRIVLRSLKKSSSWLGNCPDKYIALLDSTGRCWYAIPLDSSSLSSSATFLE